MAYRDEFNTNCVFFYWDRVEPNATLGMCRLQKGLYEEAKCENCKLKNLGRLRE